MRWKWQVQYGTQAEALIRYSRLLYERGLVSAAGGNVSCRCGDKILITASGVSLRDVTEDGILLCDREGKRADGDPNLRPSKEIGFHLGVYDLRPEVDCIIHVHPAVAVTWSLTGKELPLYTQSAKLKLVRVPLIPDGKPGSKELADLVVQTVGQASGCSAFLMEAHGILVMGETMEGCFDQAELLEDTAKIAVLRSMMR